MSARLPTCRLPFLAAAVLAATSPAIPWSSTDLHGQVIQSTEYVYVKQVSPTSFEMHRRNVNGTSDSDSKLFGGCLAKLRGYCAYLDPAISPDGTRLAFTHDAVGEVSCKTIWIADLDGHHAQQITMGCHHTEPAWSPDGRWLAFQDGDTIKQVELCRNTFPEHDPSTITSGHNPAISPDGRWVAFDRDANIYKIRRNGSGETPLAVTTSTEVQPRWTKPGFPNQKIHYLGVVMSDGGSTIIDVAPDGTGRKLRVQEVAKRDAYDVALLPVAWVWETNGEIFFRSNTTTRSLGPGRDPVMGHGSVRSAKSCP